MSITKKLLRSLSIPPSAADHILRAHREALRAVTAQRDAAQAELSTLRDLENTIAAMQETQEVLTQERDGYRAQWENLRDTQRLAQAESALRQAGANEALLPLMVERVLASAEDVPAAVSAVQAQYPQVFATVEPVGLEPLTPPVEQGGPLTSREISRMSEEQILQHWGAVRGALARRS